MKIVLDMNLSPEWIRLFENNGHIAIHWSKIGNPKSPDTDIICWAKENGYVVFTHDLDFGAILHANQYKSPSVIQIRIEDIRPATVGNIVLNVLKNTEQQIQQGALVTIDIRKNRIHLLPLEHKK